MTPVFNQAQWLEEAILSVLEQDYPNLEYLIVDDGSTDDSVEVIKRYEDRVDWWTSQPNRGQVAALNLGFSRATGDVVGWLNSDDTFLPGTIARLAELFAADPDLALAYGDALYTDEQSNRIGYLPSRDWDVATMIRNCDCHVVQPGSLFGRRALAQLLPMDETRYWFFDYELFLRLGRLGNVAHVREPLATYRLHPESKSIGAPVRKAGDYVRVADEFFVDGILEGDLAGLKREARSSAYLIAGEFYYAGLEVTAARRFLVKGLAIYPRNATARSLSLVARSFLPRAMVRRLRKRREAGRRLDGAHRN